MKADPNNLIKLKALYQAFCMTSTILNEQWGAGFPTTDQLQEHPEKYFSSEQRTSCTLFTAGKGKIHLFDTASKVTAILYGEKLPLELGTMLPWLWVNAKDFLFHYKAINYEREYSEPNSTVQK